ncbi:MAG: hydrolase TatD [Bacteroidetes bacterium]|nr:MAG: hydrolase TatD [Bacteroidota bacterium]
MLLTDSHTHLFLEEFDEDIDQVIDNAIQKGVERIFLPNIDSTTIEALNNLVQKYPAQCFPMMGLHPGSVKANYLEELDIIKAELKAGSYCAVGEIGIDLYWDKTFIKEQEDAFRQQILLAKELKLPIVIHARDSFQEIFNIIDHLNDEQLSGIFHCFTGTIDDSKRIIEYGGFKMGIGGVLTFKNAGVDKVVEQIALEHLLLETDSPYLAPAPYRGKRNESAYIIEVANKLAELHCCSIEEVAKVTTENSIEIFKV